jgi:DNA polymerase I
MPRLFLLDGTALAYRSHFALLRSSLTTPEGRPCGATYGFALTLNKILESEAPERVAVAFDPPGKTFRHERFDSYKATREKAPDEMVSQLDWIRELVRALGIPIYEVRGFEADDVIGTLALQGAAAGWDVSIVTGDKDFMQLVGPRVKLYNVFKQGEELRIEAEEAVREKFGTTPDRVIDVLAIMGDSSDNVPGVKGIGEKGAVKLIAEFGSVPELLARLAEVKGKARELIERDREMLLLSRELVTIHTDVPLDPPFGELAPWQPDPAAQSALYQRLGFISLLKKIQAGRAPAPAGRDFRMVRNEQDLRALLDELASADHFAFDTETTSLFPLQAELVGMSFSTRAGRAWYVPFNLEPPVLPGGRPALLEALLPILGDEAKARIGQNAKYDDLVLTVLGVHLPPPRFDTMVASFCVSGTARRHNLDDLALAYYGEQKIPTTDLIGRGAKQVTMAEVPVEKVAEYACEDAEVTYRLFHTLSSELDATQNRALFEELELPLVPVLTAMEERGIRLDTLLLEEIGRELETEVEKCAGSFKALAGVDVNLNSPKALGELLFEKLRIQDQAGVRRPKRTQTGWATDAETLESGYGELEIVRCLLEYREVQKLKSTYVDALPRYVNPRTGRVHCSFSQVAAATGRLASSEPNLQNIPVRSDRGKRLREVFVAPAADEHGEWLLITADYSQVELRILAHLAGDEKMRAAFAAGKDIHASTAAEVFGVAEHEVTRLMRSRAKAVNFGLLYGMGPARLARETNLTLPEARQFIERYFAAFPRVRAWQQELLARTRANGWVETLSGRRRPLPDVNSSDGRARSAAENATLNTPVQGSAADIIKRAMIELHRRLRASDLRVHLLLQVHDELVLECPASEIEAARALVVQCMEGAAELAVPLQVDTGTGRNWLEAH